MPVDITLTERPERLYSLRELAASGYGTKEVLARRIADAEIPAVMVGNTRKIRERDLGRLSTPLGGPSTVAEEMDDLAAFTARMVSTWPRLSADRRRELGRLLSAA